jgi:hypothetical protein
MVFDNSKNDSSFSGKVDSISESNLLPPTISTDTKKKDAEEKKDKKDEEKGQKEKYESLMDLLKEHLTNEFYSAILIVCEAEHLVLKIFLTLFTLVALGLSAYTTIELIMSYLQYDVITTSRTIYETPSVFPKVTFCNLNPFTTLNSLSYVNQLFSDSMLTNLSYLSKSYAVAPINLGIQGLISQKSSETKKALGHSLDDVLIGCKFNYLACTSADFSWEYDKNYGNCYSFNSGSNSSGQKVDLKMSSLAGFSYGLQLDLYVNFHENLTLFNSLYQGMGAIIRVDNVSSIIDHGGDGIFASAGSVTNIALGRENKFTMKSPYSGCILDNDVTTPFDSDIYNFSVEIFLQSTILFDSMLSKISY